jgi:hypothetical protein
MEAQSKLATPQNWHILTSSVDAGTQSAAKARSLADQQTGASTHASAWMRDCGMKWFELEY